MGSALSTTYVSDWTQECAAHFNCSSNGLVNILGQAISCPANGTIQSAPDIWGITFDACQAECGRIVQGIKASSAVVSLTTWLLPWIALIAQLPFEAGGWMDLLSACLCVGSPALATYSLALTVFNRRYIAAKFKRLKEKAETDTQQRYRYMAQRVDAVAFVLQESQQCPMRADQRTGELASLVVLPDRQNFWIIAAKDLNNTRRGFTYSFLAQVILAFMAYLVSLLAAIGDSPVGVPGVGVQFGASALWSWMFPIVFGYIRVGSQCKAGAVKEALVDNTIIPQRGVSSHGGDVQEVMYQKGLRPDADLYPPLSSTGAPPGESNRPAGSTTVLSSLLGSTKPSNSGDNNPRVEMPERDGSVAINAGHQHEHSKRDSEVEPTDTAELERVLPPPTWLGMDVRGDERREGPIFNYARVFTWFAFAEHVGRAFETSIHNMRIRANRTVIPVDLRIPPVADQVAILPETEKATTNPLLTAQNAAYCCGLAQSQDLRAFMFWEELPAAAIQHILYAAFVALFLQWGTTGAAIFVEYNTPAVGLGCRSGSYLIYGVAATVSWFLLVCSQFCSHELMKRLERDPHRQTVGDRILAGLAVVTRVVGKAIAIANAGWLITLSVLEEIGAFQTCLCQTDAFQHHASKWISLFPREADMGLWIGGFTWSIVVCIFTAVIFNV
ncbi:hypothetical protein B0H12DRAFT_274609 [Mycena haematopus]|nr:hypothetical protein B0H12DRAFT_274609 [Mycena haematopus]